ncbi:MAG: DNA repair protein RadC [Eubacterium sp.]|nr:DNA repair protein RadC [Eubacterium sp.]
MSHKIIKELPSSERPYEQAERYGVKVLSDAELLAVIIKSGTIEKTSIELAHDILDMSETYPGLLGLYHAKLPDLLKISGIGRVKALSLMCVAELSKRLARETKSCNRRLCGAEAIASFFMEEMRSFETEHFYAAFFDAMFGLIRYEDVFRGTVNCSLASPREVLRLALTYDAVQIVILHNHPSGDPTPSSADDRVTEMFIDACECVGVQFMDHIIIGDNCYISYHEAGLM